MNAPIEYIVRGVVEEEGKILLCHGKGKPNWYFPGGHIEPGESAPDALLREIEEEMGTSASIEAFLGVSEQVFTLNEIRTHEINLVFKVSLDVRGIATSKEDHIEFAWFSREELKNLLVYPLSLCDAIITQPSDTKEPLWVSEGFSA